MAPELPIEVIKIIGGYLTDKDPQSYGDRPRFNPFLLVKWSHISPSFRRFFLSPQIWDRLKTRDDDSAAEFIQRMSTAHPKLVEAIKEAWRGKHLRSVRRRMLDSSDYALACAASQSWNDLPDHFCYRAFCRSVLYFNPRYFVHFGKWKEDRDIVLEAVANCKYILKDLNPSFLLDRQVALAAVSHYGQSLSHFPAFCGDFEVCRAAARCDGEARHYMSEDLMVNKDIMMASLEFGEEGEYQEINPLELDRFVLNSPLLYDEEVILKAATKWFNTLYLAPHFNNNKKIVLAAVTTFSYSLEFASESLKDDWQVVEAALSNNYHQAMPHASERQLRKYREKYGLPDKNPPRVEQEDYGDDDVYDNDSIDLANMPYLGRDWYSSDEEYAFNIARMNAYAQMFYDAEYSSD